MKILTLACLVLVVSACKKFDGGDILHANNGIAAASHDTIPDRATFTLRLYNDESNSDETVFIFNCKAGTAFNWNNDATYFTGFGQVSLASTSSDGRDMAIYELPYSSGMSVGLNINSKKDGTLNLGLSKVKDIPAGVRIWVNDTYSRDSLDLCKGPYKFRVDKADTNSYGGRRLKLMLMSGPPMYWPGF